MGFGELCFIHLGSDARIGWVLLRYLEATALLLGAKLGDLEGKLGYWEVMLKSSWAMLRYVILKLYVRFCSAMLVALYPEMLSPGRTKVLSGFLRAMLAPFGGQVRLPYGYVGAILGRTSAILGLC